MVWDITVPTGTEDASSGDDRIRELKTDIQGALRGQDTDGLEAKFPGADTSAPVFRYRGLRGATAARPTAGDYGLYVDTTRNALQRDNGTSWDDVATLIPAGTVMVFYQAAAPVGWTKVTTQNDKALRVVSGGTGGTAGGSIGLSTDLTHSVSAHNHTISHKHTTPVGAINGNTIYIADNGAWVEGTESVNVTHDAAGAASAPGAVDFLKTRGSDTDNSGDATVAVASHGVLAYADVILCSKD